MIQKIRLSAQRILPITIGTALLALFVLLGVAQPVSAINQIPTPEPKPGSYGLAATKVQDPPTVFATITTPGNGASFSTSPITVSGICTTDLLVQIYNNNVMVGSVICANGSFSLEVSLFAGINELTAILYDSLEQAGPTSNIVSVTYTDTNFTSFGELITLTSTYGRRSAQVGSELTWPLQLSGGTGPYAFSIDWGDGTQPQLVSQALAGTLDIRHTYKKAGIYRVNIRVTDANGVTAFLQVIAVSSGQVEAAPTEQELVTQKTTILWIPAAVALALLIPTYWLGRRSQLVSLHNKMLKERDALKTDQV